MISAHSANPCRRHNLVAKQVLSIFASLYAKARHQLDDYQNKQALRIVRETQAIGLETLNVHGMSRIHGRSVLTVAPSRFVMKLEHKAQQ